MHTAAKFADLFLVKAAQCASVVRGYLKVPAGELGFPEELLLAASLVIIQPDGDDGVSGNSLEARWLGRREARLKGLPSAHLVGWLP